MVLVKGRKRVPKPAANNKTLNWQSPLLSHQVLTEYYLNAPPDRLPRLSPDTQSARYRVPKPGTLPVRNLQGFGNLEGFALNIFLNVTITCLLWAWQRNASANTTKPDSKSQIHHNIDD